MEERRVRVAEANGRHTLGVREFIIVCHIKHANFRRALRALRVGERAGRSPDGEAARPSGGNQRASGNWHVLGASGMFGAHARGAGVRRHSERVPKKVANDKVGRASDGPMLQRWASVGVRNRDDLSSEQLDTAPANRGGARGAASIVTSGTPPPRGAHRRLAELVRTIYALHDEMGRTRGTADVRSVGLPKGLIQGRRSAALQGVTDVFTRRRNEGTSAATEIDVALRFACAGGVIPKTGRTRPRLTACRRRKDPGVGAKGAPL